MNLISVSEGLKMESLEEEFARFVNEAGPQTYAPSNTKIINAIKKRKYAGIYYEEEGSDKVLSGFRLIEPLVFGKGYKSADGVVTHKNEYYLRAFVIKESQKDSNKELHKIHRKSVSKSKRVPYYRLFKMERIKTWENFRFTIINPREDYNPDDQMIAEIMQSIKFN